MMLVDVLFFKRMVSPDTSGLAIRMEVGWKLAE